MLVLLGPPFEGTEEEYQTLAGTTGLVVYDLKTKLKPGAWGLVRVLADQEQANDLGTRLSAAGFRIAVIDHDIAHDPARTVVALRSIELNRDHMVLHLRERSMPVPYQALLTIVRGEVQLGRNYGRSSGTSGASFRAVVSPVDAAALRESAAVAPLDAFAAADLHFATVFWVARIDARHFDFSALGNPAQSGAQDLDRLVDMLAARAGVRVDRSLRISSVASFAARPPPMRSVTPTPGPVSARTRDAPADDRFDAYSKLVAEAERQTMMNR